MQKHKQENSRLKKIVRWSFRVVLFLFLFVILLGLLVLTPPVQNFIKQQAVSFLEGKIKTKVAIDRVHIGLPKTINLKGVYLEDQTGDTLLYSGSIHVDIGIWGLITGKGVHLRSVELSNFTAKINRQLPDTSFNFQYIIDAFASDTPREKDASGSSMAIALGDIKLENIRAVYKDDVTGYDAVLHLGSFTTKMEEFDVDAMRFGIGETTLQGINAIVHQSAPLSSTVDNNAVATVAVLPALTLGKIRLEDINVEYNSVPGAIYGLINLGSFSLHTNQLDLKRQLVDIETVSLENTSAIIRLAKTDSSKKEASTMAPLSEGDMSENAGWKVLAASLQLNNINLQFDDEATPRQAKGMDYMHLKADTLSLHAKNFLYNNDSIAGSITKGQLKEQSGFILNELQTDFLYASNQAYLKNLLIKTPGTEIKKSLVVKYPSIAAIQKDINLLQFDVDLENSRLQLKDVLTFVPDLDIPMATANDIIRLDSRIKGTVNDLQIPVLKLTGLGNTIVDVSGSLKSVQDINNMSADLSVKNLATTRADVYNLLPKGSLPDNITLPATMSLFGNVKGNGGKLNTDLRLQTSLGNLDVKGYLEQISDPQKAVYDLTLQTQQLDLGTILQNQEMLGPVSLTLTAKGKAYDLRHADATFSGKILDAVVKNYRYKDLIIKGNIAQQQAHLNAAIADSNIHIKLDAVADLTNSFPAIQLNVDIDSIKTQALHLTKDVVIYRGKINADFPVTNPDSLEGKLFILQSLLVHNQHRIQMDSIQLQAGYRDSVQFAELKSDVIYALLKGKYKLTEMGGIAPRLINPYFLIDSTASTSGDFDFIVNATINQSPVLNAFVPGLTRLDSVKIDGRFSSHDGWNMYLTAPAIVYGSTVVNSFGVNAYTTDSALIFDAGVQGVQVGESVQLFKSNIGGSLVNNKADILIHLKDKQEKEKYHLNLLVDQAKNGVYGISLVPDSLLLHYQPWSATTDNRITIAPDDIYVNNFTVEKDGQSIRLQSQSVGPNAPLQVSFNDFKVSTITGFVQSDSIGVNGRINGDVVLSNITSQPLFEGNIRLDDLSIKKDTVGNVAVKVDNTIANTYRADVSVTGRGNDLQLTGTYETINSSIDMNLDIRTIPLQTVEALSGGALRNASGNVNGQFTASGSFDQLKVNGGLGFDKAAFNVSMLNNYFKIDQQQMLINEEGIRFNRFQVQDSANNALTLDGLAATTNFKNFNLDLTLQANNFGALNSTRKDNDIFYGKLYFDSNLKISGTEAAPEIDGRLKINDKTAMTVVLPQAEPGVVEREGVVVFVDRSVEQNDSLFLVRYDSLNTTSIQGIDLSVNVEVDKEAAFTVIVDEGSGDQLQVKGGAQLNVGVEPGGKVSMSGAYEIDKGSYDFSFNLLKRAFQIQQGSKITWGGEPTDATVDITAVYTANTSPLDLVKNQLGAEVSAAERNTYLQKLPFDVLLKMEGELMRPKISFDIILPEEKTTGISSNITSSVKAKLDMMRQDEAEMNKQVFALLLLNRFVAEDPFSSSGGTSTATMVRQSVNKIMTDQLNRWAADLIKGVDINFDMESTDDYSTGERQEKTDLNVGLSKRMLNDRLTVTVGSNFELDGPQANNNRGSNIAGNVNIQYRLSQDGRYMLRGYRVNEYQGIIEGYVVETGIGFTITMDYNRFREIFQKRRTREEREKRREERQAEKRSQSENTRKKHD